MTEMTLLFTGQCSIVRKEGRFGRCTVALFNRYADIRLTCEQQAEGSKEGAVLIEVAGRNNAGYLLQMEIGGEIEAESPNCLHLRIEADNAKERLEELVLRLTQEQDK